MSSIKGKIMKIIWENKNWVIFKDCFDTHKTINVQNKRTFEVQTPILHENSYPVYYRVLWDFPERIPKYIKEKVKMYFRRCSFMKDRGYYVQ